MSACHTVLPHERAAALVAASRRLKRREMSRVKRDCVYFIVDRLAADIADAAGAPGARRGVVPVDYPSVVWRRFRWMKRDCNCCRRAECQAVRAEIERKAECTRRRRRRILYLPDGYRAAADMAPDGMTTITDGCVSGGGPAGSPFPSIPVLPPSAAMM